MSPEGQLAQTTCEAASVSMRETVVVPTLLPVCCMCGLIRDQTGSTPGREGWVKRRTYRETHGVNPADFPLTHTYCPACFTKVKNSVKQYLRKIGTLP